MLAGDLFSIALTLMVLEKVLCLFSIFDLSFDICPSYIQGKDKQIHAHQCDGEGDTFLVNN